MPKGIYTRNKFNYNVPRYSQKFSRKRENPIVLFEKHVYPEPNTGCWLWGGCYSHRGYGQFQVHTSSGSKKINASRASYQFYKGITPSDKDVCLTCDIRACVNPDHLFLGSRQDNVNDCVNKGRHARGSKQGSAKLTEKEVIEIKGLVGSMTNKEISKIYKVTPPAIRAIKEGISWSWL